MKKILLSICTVFLLITQSHAFDPKGKTVTVTIPFAPGGGVDHTFKELQRYASQRGIELSPVFKPGAESTVGTLEVSRGSRDGLNFGISTAGGIALYKLKFPTDSISIVTGIKTTAQVIVTHPKSGIKNHKDLEAALKEGRKLTIAIGNPGQRIVWDQFLKLSEVKNQPIMVSYKGAGQVLTDIIGGHVDLTYLPITALKSNIDSGKLIPIFVNHSISDWPQVVTLKSNFPSWKEVEFGHVLFVADKTDPVIIKYWENFIKEFLENSSVRDDFKKTYSFPLPLGQPIAENTINQIKISLDEVLKNQIK